MQLNKGPYFAVNVGGGETAMAVHRAGESENMSFISTGGGAALSRSTIERSVLTAVLATRRIRSA